jgi:hypothetical protein
LLEYEFKKDFHWKQTEFQCYIENSEVYVAYKNKTAFVHPFRGKIFMAGNEMITSWQNNAGSLTKRLIIIYFRHYIPKEKSNPLLMQEIKKRITTFNTKI